MISLVRLTRIIRNSQFGCQCQQRFASDFIQGTNQVDNQVSSSQNDFPLFDISTPAIREDIIKNMTILENFITTEEQQSLINELEPYMKRLRYEFDHWDNAIHGYRETEKLRWNEKNKKILDRIQKIAFPESATPLQYIHVLDLAKNGYIKPHVDSVRFCGNIITGLSLLSTSVMRLVHEKKPELKADVLLPQNSLYIMRNVVRFDYTHEILDDKSSFFNGRHIPRERRISIMCRNEPINNE